MQAIVQDTYGSPDVLELREIDKPAIADDELLVRVHAAGVDPGVWHLMTGLPYLVRVMGAAYRPRKAPVRGVDVAGRVEAVGAKVTEFQEGDELFGTCNGSFAEYVCVKERERSRAPWRFAHELAPKPANLTFEQAAAVPVSACAALHGLRDRGEVRAEQRVLIIGAGGGVGTFAVQLAKAFGAQVTGVCSTTKLDLVRSIGADNVIDHTREDFADGRHRYDVILDTAGRRSLSHLRRALTPRGTLVIVGGEGGGRWLGGFQRIILAAPMLSLFVSQRLRGLTSAERKEDLQFLTELIEAGRVMPVIDRTYPLSEAPDAIRYLHGGHARGKVVITVDS